MATWIGHLRVAEALLDALPALDETAFALGSLAPDSGVPNADWSEFDPPKAVTHFLRDGGGEDRIHDLEFYRDYLSAIPMDDRPRYSYALGYFFHLLCDNLWIRLVWYTARAEAAMQFAEQGSKYIWTLKKDWYDLDFLYLRDHPDSLFWRALLPAPNPPAYLPFLTQAGVHQSLDHIRHQYSHPGADMVLDRDYPYLNEATMSRYVGDATAAILNIHREMSAGVSLHDQVSALFLLSESSLTPYAPPLGDAL